MAGQEKREKVREMLDQYFLRAQPNPLPAPSSGWIRTIRRSLKMTEAELAARMGVTQATLHRIEKNEAAGKIQLESLRRAAEALNCDLHISMVPRKPLQETYYERALELAKVELSSVNQTMKLEDQEPKDSSGLAQHLAQELIRQNRVSW